MWGFNQQGFHLPTCKSAVWLGAQTNGVVLDIGCWPWWKGIADGTSSIKARLVILHGEFIHISFLHTTIPYDDAFISSNTSILKVCFRTVDIIEFKEELELLVLGQRKRTLDASAYEAANAVEIKQGEPFTATWVSNLKRWRWVFDIFCTSSSSIPFLRQWYYDPLSSSLGSLTGGDERFPKKLRIENPPSKPLLQRCPTKVKWIGYLGFVASIILASWDIPKGM